MAFTRVDLTSEIDLRNSEFLTFIDTYPGPDEFAFNKTLPQDFEVIAERMNGMAHTVDAVVVIREQYDVFKVTLRNGTTTETRVAEAWCDIFRTQSVSVSVKHQILCRSTLHEDKKQALRQAVQGYDPAADGDIISYARAVVAKEGVDGGDVRVLAVGVAQKFSNPPVDKTEQRDLLLELYAGKRQKTECQAIGYETSLSLYLHDNYVVKLVGTKRHSEHAEPGRGEVEGAAPEVPPTDAAIKASAELNYRKLEGKCVEYGVEVDKYQIATVASIPELKVTWITEDIEIGCGVWITISYPRLQTRTSRKILYATIGRPANSVPIAILHIEDCAKKAAILGAVVGIVLWNFAAAAATFQASFNECIKYKASEFVSCLTPEIILATESEDWVPKL